MSELEQVLRPLLQEMLQPITNDLAELKADVSGLKADVTQFRADLEELREESRRRYRRVFRYARKLGLEFEEFRSQVFAMKEVLRDLRGEEVVVRLGAVEGELDHHDMRLTALESVGGRG
ncbi:MAG: hypothetical protein U0931_26295 [Vulcanimicrobiota bacterium]